MKKYYALFQIFVSTTADLISSNYIFSKVILLISIMVVLSAEFTSAQIGPDIAIWYGDEQTFGEQGVPQPWVNILGNISNVDGVASLYYTLNGGSNITLSIGPDSRRLQLSGDFNIDLPTSDLIDGANTVIITATDNQGQTLHTVTVNYTSTNVWPLPYNIDWQAPSTAVNSVSQAVDGNWEVTSDGIHTVTTGYDRLVAIGDMTWDDYEITVPVTIHNNINTSHGIGVLLRWTGHTDYPVICAQPKCGYLPLGAICWYRGNRLEIYGNDGDILATQTRSLDLETIYMFKARVVTNPGIGGQYSFKVWKQSDTEPAGWDITAQESLSDPQNGSLMLISHHGDVTFGNVSVSPISISITNVQAIVNSGNTSATISWNTNVPASSQVAYGLTSAYELGNVTDATLKTTHSLELIGLDPDTEYHYQITSVTAEAEEAITGDLTFTTITSDIVSDDFHLPLLNTSLWTFIDPVGDCGYDLVGSNTTDAWLNIEVPAGTEHQLWESGIQVPHVLQSCNNADFEVEAKFESPVNLPQYQEQGILVRQDDDTFIRFEFFSRTTGTFVYVESFVPGSHTNHADLMIGTTGLVPLYMRVKRQSDQWTASYSTDGVIWSQSASFTFAITVTGVGPYAGNAVGGSSPAHTGSIDYFFNTASPVIPEDPISGDVVVITSTPVTAAVIGQLYIYDVDATGIPAPTFSLLTAPTGMTIDGSSGLIEWTPDTPGDFDVSVQANNTIPYEDIQDFVIHVTGITGSAVSDDFNHPALDATVWSFIDPLGGGGYTLTGTCTDDAWINISVPGGSEHQLWDNGIMVPHILQACSDTDFEIEVKFESSLNGEFQEQGILIKNDDANFIRFEFYSNTSNTNVIAATLTGTPSVLPLTHDIKFNSSIGPVGMAPLYMRVNRTENHWIQSYSFDGNNWTLAATFDHTLVVTAVGTYAGNAGSFPAHTSSVDYFFNTTAPVSPEDAPRAGWLGAFDTDWYNNDNWCGGVPTTTSDIIIPTGLTNYPDIDAAGAVCQDITIESGASLSITGANTLNVSGNWVNNGSFTENSSTVTFDGTNALQTISGSSTTTFYMLNVDLGDQVRILEATSIVALSSTSDPLVITSGSFKLSSASTIAPFTSNTGAVIPAIGGLWNNGGTINTDNSCSWTNYGMIKNSSGAINIGVNSGNSFKYYSGSSFIMDGGTVTIAGRFYPNTTTQTIDFNMSDGVLTIVDVGFSSSSWASFDIPASASAFTMSGGTIIIKNPNGNATSPRDYRNEAGAVNITSGTLQFGTTSTTGSPNYIVGDGNTTSCLPDVSIVQATTATTVTLDSPIMILGDISINSGTTLDANGRDIEITGDWNNAGGTYTPGTNITTFDGISDQTLSGGDTYYDVVINKTTGNIVLANDNTITNTFAFHASNLGNIITGANKLILGNDASSAVNRQGSGHIIGSLQRAIAADANSYLYPLGTPSAYTPVEIDFTAGTLAGSLTGATVDGDHPNVASSGFDGASSINRHWDFTVSSGLGTANYDATFNWVGADEDAGFDYSIANAGKLDGSTWTYPTMGTLSTNSAQITGVSGFSDFQIGNYLTATISGYFNYYNNAKTPLDAVDVDLEQASSTIQSTTTNASGYYEFTGIDPGDYDVVTDYSEQTGYINSTDAAQANYWVVNPSSIELTRFYAGDVTNDLSVNSGDAGLIQQHFLTLGNPNPAFVTDWTFWTTDEMISSNPGAGGYPTATVLIGETSVSQDFYGLGTGDFNGSFTPGAKETTSETLTLSYGDFIEVGLSEFELPLYAGMDMNVGAVSLILDIPSDYLNLKDIYLENNPDMTLLYSVSGDETRISWQSATPVFIQKGLPLLTLLLELNKNPENNEIMLSLVPNQMNELADNSYFVINKASLVVDIIKSTILGISGQNALGHIDLSSHPNPFTETVSFEYYIPVDGHVTLEIYNLLGKKVKVVVDELQSAGDYLFKADGLNLEAGIYLANLKVDGNNDSFIRTIKTVSK